MSSAIHNYSEDSGGQVIRMFRNGLNDRETIKKQIIEKVGEESYNFISKHVDPLSEETYLVSTTNDFNITNYLKEPAAIINLTKVNNIRRVNKFFEKVNSKLSNGGLYIVCLETIKARKEKHRLGNIPVLKNLWFALEFIFLRVFPKIWGLKKVYFLITRGRNRLLSKAEVMGRLVSCGFVIIDSNSFNGKTYIVSKRVKEPEFNMHVSYGPIFRMNRLGKGGKIIGVYKFRTMHPYAEYLQDYVLKLNGYGDSGKPKDDFRLTPWGRFLRRYWLDELPQLINVLKGDLKLVGVRPISLRYYQDIPRDLQMMRGKVKPGCIPPYVSLDRKADIDSVLDAEREYLRHKLKHPYTTDISFFFRAIYNIIFKRKRSA
jgi:lipopolysaccharide/colanic/teichoic acid biosynthesis glycosyltransferase